MCGIAGYLGRGFGPRVLADFGARLAQRGPDGHGVWRDAKAGAGLAHRRLSIIDLSTAASQPMVAVGGRYVVSFNGEIYNFKALVPELKRRGYSFNENSDTAVLAPLYDAFGPAMLDKLEGMFAFAIWDREKQELFVARDHLGIKPLYYAEVGGGFVFASELKALVGVKGIDGAVDAVALADYLTFLWSPSARTMLRGVKKLRPGHWLRAKMQAERVQVDVRAWWWPPQAPMRHGKPVYDYVKSAAGLREVFDAVVAEQCVADVPLGAFLSGGVDSSAIVASMVAQKMKPAMTYCIGFKGAGMAAEGFEEDMAHARCVAKHLKVKLREIVVDAEGILARLPTLAWTLDEPCADPAPLFVEDISLAAREDGLKVLMSGTGGDDVMSGYRRHMVARQRQRLGVLAGVVGMGMSAVAPWLGGATRRRAERLGGLLRLDEEAFLRAAFATNGVGAGFEFGAGLLRADLREEVMAARREGWEDDLARAQRESRGQDLVNRLLYSELHGFLPDHNLNYGDKAGMLAGVEIRVPFTDRRLLNWMADVPPETKLRGGWLGMEAKAFFKESQVGRLPDSVLDRSKTGFGAPIRSWLTGAGKTQVEAALFEGAAAEWFDAKAVGNLWQGTLSGRVDGAYTLLALCMAGWWQERMLG